MANRIDDIFSKKLGQREFTPLSSDWAAMETMIDSSLPPVKSGSNATINWMFLTSFIVLISISTIAVHSSNQSNKVPISNLSEIEQARDNMQTSSASSTVTTGQKPTDEIQYSKTNKNGIINYEELDENKPESNVQSTNAASYSYFLSEKNNLDLKNIVENQENNSTITDAILAENEISNSPQNSINPNNTYLVTNKIALKQNNDEAFKRGQVEESQSLYYSNDDQNEAVSTSEKKKIEASYYYPSFSRKSGASSTIIFDDKAFHLLSKSVKYLQDVQLAEIVIPENSTNPIHSTHINKGKRSLPLQFSVAAFGELSYITKKITGDSEFSSLINTRKREEKNIIAAGGGLEFQVSYKGFGLTSGLHLSKWGENVQYEEKYKSEWELSSFELMDTLWTEVITITIDSVYSPVDSTFISIIDSSYVTVIDSIIITTNYDSTEVLTELGLAKQNGKTTISYWEIPLFLSYQLDLGKIYLNPGIGINIGFLKVTHGYYMAKDLISLIEINHDYAIIRRTFFTGQIQFGVGYRLNNKFSFELTPAIKFNLNNIFTNPNLIQKYTVYSLQFRLRYHF
jgi:hypothetical protein